MTSSQTPDAEFMLVIDSRLAIPLSELNFSFARSRGPGGQNVNKLNTKATLRWDVTRSPSIPQDIRNRLVARFRRRINKDGVLLISSQRFRDQGRNVADCLHKLRELVLSVAEPPAARIPTRTPRQSRERRLRDKRLIAQKKQRRRPPPLEG